MKFQTATATVIASVESVLAHVVSKAASVRKSIVKIQLAQITVFVLMAVAFVKKAGQVKIVQLKTKLQFLVFQLVLGTESLTCTLRNVFAILNLAVMIARWNFVT